MQRREKRETTAIQYMYDHQKEGAARGDIDSTKQKPIEQLRLSEALSLLFQSFGSLLPLPLCPSSRLLLLSFMYHRNR